MAHPDHFDMPQQHCPVCGCEFNAATAVHGEGPPDSDSVTLCIRCGAVLGWDPAMRLYRLTAQEIKELPRDVFKIVAQSQQWVFSRRGERN